MSNFKEYLKENYGHNELADIANHGCSGGIGGMIYYSDCIRLYTKYADDIHEIMGQYCDETGEKYPEYVAKELQTFSGFACAALWFAAEWVANEITHGEYVEYEQTA